MATVEHYKAALIKKISAINDKELLMSLKVVLENFQEAKSNHITTDLEKKAIQKGIAEIQNGNFLSQEDIDSDDMKWLQEK